MGAAVGFALAAAVCIAVASALQHQAATGEAGYRSGAHLLARLARNRRWTAGFVISVVGLGLHGVALHAGALAVVQPLLVTSLVFALPLRALLEHRRPPPVEVAAAVVVTVALAAFLLAAHPTAGHPGPDSGAFVWVLATGVVVVGTCSAVATRVSRAAVAGFSLGLASGVLYGLVGGSLKATAHAAAGGFHSLLFGWPLWVLLITGVWALVVNQRAYTRAPLRVSLPVLTVANPVVAIVFGAYVFGEKPNDSPAAVAVQIACLAALAAGVTALAVPPRPPSPQLR